MSALNTSAFCLTAPSTHAPTATAYSIEKVLATGEISEITDRLITIGGFRLLATPNRTVRIDHRTILRDPCRGRRSGIEPSRSRCSCSRQMRAAQDV